jgi:DNA (cytosine-5)-methyltransferase 1
MNYYNENDPFAAQWLRNLIAANLIPQGFVDERSILDVKPADLGSYTQCHFFAGIGGWSLALQIAAWPVHRKVWTGSCPCQPFSSAGKAGGFTDERHLWPAWFHLIVQCQPEQILGEQVASKAGLEWYDLVRTDLEGASFAVACADLCAASAGAPHIRQRLWFVANASSVGRQDGRLGGKQLEEKSKAGERNASEQSRRSPWSDLEWLPCTDGKARPTKSGIFPLAHGIPGRVGRLRAYGNAIVPQVAAAFIASYLEQEPPNAHPHD